MPEIENTDIPASAVTAIDSESPPAGATDPNTTLDRTEPAPGEQWEALFKKRWNTYDELFDEVSSIARILGFGFSKRRASNYGPDGEPRRIDFQCAEGPESKESKATGKRPKAASIKKDCPWATKAVFLAGDVNKWTFDYIEDRNRQPRCKHDHELDPKGAGFLAVHRRNDRDDEITKFVINQHKLAKTTSSDIAAAVRAQWPEKILLAEDVKNIIKRYKEEVAGPLTPTQQFLQHVTTTPGVWNRIYRKNNDPKEKIQRVFWTYPWCTDQLKKNPEVWGLDCTYKVNRFDMPLLQICGITSMHTTFPIAYCLLSGEREACFEWVLSVMKELLVDKEIDYPKVIISDYDQAFKKACRTVFNEGDEGGIQHQICLWHVMKNVAFNTRKKWIGSLEGTSLGERGSAGSHLRTSDEIGEEEPELSIINPSSNHPVAGRVASRLLDPSDRAQFLGTSVRDPTLQAIEGTVDHNTNPRRKWLPNADGFLSAWRAVVYAETEESFLEEWATLKKEFSDQPDLIDYLTTTYLPIRYEFCQFSIKRHRNFGVRVTSRVEGMHGLLKRLIKNRLVDLNGLLGAIEETLRRIQTNYHALHKVQTSKKVREYSDPVLRPLRYLVSFAALDIINKQIGIASRNTPDQPCSRHFIKQFGLPCWHMIRGLKNAGAQLTLGHVAKHWHLKERLPSSEFLALQNEQDPDRVPNARRTAVLNGPQPPPTDNSTRRDPSHDEPLKPPKKRAKKMTAAQQTAALQSQVASLVQTVTQLATQQSSQPAAPPLVPSQQWGGIPVLSQPQFVMPPPPTQPFPPPSQQLYIPHQHHFQQPQRVGNIGRMEPQNGYYTTNTLQRVPPTQPAPARAPGSTQGQGQYGEFVMRFD